VEKYRNPWATEGESIYLNASEIWPDNKMALKWEWYLKGDYCTSRFSVVRKHTGK